MAALQGAPFSPILCSLGSMVERLISGQVGTHAVAV